MSNFTLVYSADSDGSHRREPYVPLFWKGQEGDTVLQLTVLAKQIFPSFKTRLAIRRAVFFPLDVLDRMAGKRDPLVPPRGLWFVGGGHFRENQFRDSFVDLCDLMPHHRVLDVGCGIGKQAVPLTQYLSPEGSYEGFDIVKEGVQWCQQEISSRFPNFRFKHVDVFNKHYNPQGSGLPSQWKFPYSDAQFDFVYAISVFTHMLPDAVKNYLNEIGRVLKPKGTAFISFLLLNDASLQLIAQGKSTIALVHEHSCYSVLDPKFPETAIGLSEDFVKKCYEESGLTISALHYGSWSGRCDTRFYQDIVISVRP
jgi:SAM-dependent methyltransferase